MCKLAQIAINNSVRWSKSRSMSPRHIKNFSALSTKLKMPPVMIKFICILSISLGLLIGLVHPVFSESGPIPPVTLTRAPDNESNRQFLDDATAKPCSNLLSNIDVQLPISGLPTISIAKLTVSDNPTENDIYNGEIAAARSDPSSTDAGLYSDHQRDGKSSSLSMKVTNSLKARHGEERSMDMNRSTLAIPFNTPSTGDVSQRDSAVTFPSGPELAADEISDTITVRFYGAGSGMEECSGGWGYQRINFNIEVDIEVVGVNPSQVWGNRLL